MKSYNGFSAAQRMRALAWVKKQYAAGTRHPPVACDACSQDKGIIERHSEDYSEPFGEHIGAYAFCFTCHMMLHARFRSPEAWRGYKAAVAAGAVFAPFYGRNFPAFNVAFLNGSMPRPGMRDPPERHVLDEIG